MFNFQNYAKWKEISCEEWTDWKWQYNNCITSVDELKEIIPLSSDEIAGITAATAYYRMKLSPHICLMMAENSGTPVAETLKRQFLPTSLEIIHDTRLFPDVNLDKDYMPVNGLVHRYPTKVLLFPSNNCGTFCRYCFRKKYVGAKEDQLASTEYEPIFSYLQSHHGINEVIFSGGDPLTASDETIQFILERLALIENIRIVRFHTRMPITIPYRICDTFIDLLRKYRNRFALYFVIHIDTLGEISSESFDAISKLTDSGISCLASCPLLQGINDSEEALSSLWQALVEHQIKPYYLFHTDPVEGIRHFVVPFDKGLGIIRNIYDRISGIGIPLYCFNIPEGGGHILLSPSNVKKIGPHKYELLNFEGKVFEYNEPIDGD